MDEGYSLSQARAMLGNVDIKTLNDWLAKAGMTAKQGKVDKRFWYLSREQLDVIAFEHGRELREVQPHKPITLSELSLLIEDQRTTIRRLEACVKELDGTTLKHVATERTPPIQQVSLRPRAAPLYPADVNAAPPTTRSRPVAVEQTRSRQPGQIGIGIRFAAQIAMNHGANSWGAARDWNWPTTDLVSETTALAFIKHYLTEHPRSGTWRPFCERTACPCYGITTAQTATHDEEREGSALLEDRNGEPA